MIDGRRRMLDRVRRAAGSASLPAEPPAHPGSPPDARPEGDLVEAFARECEAVGGRVHRAPHDAAAVATVADIVLRRVTDPVLTWSESSIGLPGLLETLRARGAKVLENLPLPGTGPGREAPLSALAACGVGITGADFGLAESGSVVLSTGPGRGRLASLLPPVHVAVLRASRVVWTLADAFARDADAAARASNLVVVTGPSRTADIEMTLTRGVHGPGELHVVLIATSPGIRA